MDSKRRRALIALLVVITSALGGYLLMRFPNAIQIEAAQSPAPKYIFIFLADGAGITQLETTRLYNRRIHHEGLNITDRIFKEGSLGLMTTHSADLLITDSAASATAMAGGCKTRKYWVGICEDGSVPKSVLQIAKEKGMRIGLVTNSEIYDASPAAFVTHVSNRFLSDSIIEQYLKFEPDLLMGGGRDHFLPKGQPGSCRKDDRDMIDSFKKRGYTYVSDKHELAHAKGAKILGLFSLRDMSFEIDRDKNIEPSIYDMTQAAIRLLQEGPKRGFVVFIESGHPDSAAHQSDVAALIHDLREFDRSVGLAYEFYKKYPRETLILVTADHETGGLAFMGAGLDPVERVHPSTKSLERIHSINISISKAVKILGRQPSSEGVDRLMTEHFKGFVLPPELKEALIKKKPLGPTFHLDRRAAALGALVAHNTQAYWIGHGHTNQPVFVGALGVGAERFRGYQDNTDFARHLFALLGEKVSP